MTLTCQSHDLCKITVWAISQLLMGKMLLLLTQDSLSQVLHVKEIEEIILYTVCNLILLKCMYCDLVVLQEEILCF